MKKEIKEKVYRLIHPKPALLITSVHRNGRPNVMVCGWATPVSMGPMQEIMICLRKKGYTGSLIRSTKEFVINIPHSGLMKAINICGSRSGRKFDKAKLAGLTYAKAKKIKVPVIKQCIGHIECKLARIVSCGGMDNFIGKVVYACADSGFYKNRWLAGAKIPMHLGGPYFTYFK